MRRLLLTGVLLVGTLSGLVQGGTVATFTSSAASGSNQFTAGTLTLGVGLAAGTLTVSNLVPGEQFTARLTVQNAGSLDLRYAMTTSPPAGASALADTLELTVRTSTDQCSTFTSTLYGPAPLGGAAFGDPARGQQAGDRTLASGASEDLCFTVALPPDADAALQGASVTATFTFSAEQLAAA